MSRITEPPLVLCATSRLAQVLREQSGVGDAPRVSCRALTIPQWLAQAAEELSLRGLADLPACLDPYAERLLWEQVIAAGLKDAGGLLFDIQGMAAAAAEAHALGEVWNLQAEGAFLAEETQLFLSWQRDFLRRCESRQWLDAARWQGRVIDLLATGALALPPVITFAGFDRPAPPENRLRQILRGLGVTVEEQAPPLPLAGELGGLAFADTLAECRGVAAWAQQTLLESPEARLGVVVPDLAGVRHALEWALEDSLNPAMIRPAAAELPRRYNFSLGRALAEIPLVATALDLLALAPALGRSARLEQARLAALLASPYWSATVSEADGRARLDAAMRAGLGHFTSLDGLFRLARRLAAEQGSLCPRTMAALQAFDQAVQSAARSGGGRKRRPGEWGPVLKSWLKAAHWPGERGLSSHEFQAQRAFLDVLDGLAGLDQVLGAVSLGEVLRRLGQCCRERVFQAETRGRPAVQVLGVLESAGLEFDALWVMGMNDHRWPPLPRPNPLLPAELQRAAASPHASAEVEQAFAATVHARLLRSARQVVFSWAASEGGRPLRPSPLVQGIPPSRLAIRPAPGMAERLLAGARLELLSDDKAPPVQEGEKVPGGTWLLRAQAICPAWGYFQYRLAATALKIPVEGLDAAARGSLTHLALECFWRQMESQQALLDLAPALRQKAVEAAVERALEAYESERHAVLPPRFRQLERARLVRLLTVWLAVEMERPQPFVVAACEQEAVVDIEGIRVRMFVDRIDQLADGRRIIIDYKTGAGIDTRNWAEERISEPQLPIYAAIAAPQGIAAVAFAKVLVDQPAFAGVAASSGLLPDVRGIDDDKQKLFDRQRFPDWEAVLAHWHERLHAIAREVREGAAGVVFRDLQQLGYCEVLPILRLAERQAQLEEAKGQ